MTIVKNFGTSLPHSFEQELHLSKSKLPTEQLVSVLEDLTEDQKSKSPCGKRRLQCSYFQYGLGLGTLRS